MSIIFQPGSSLVVKGTSEPDQIAIAGGSDTALAGYYDDILLDNGSGKTTLAGGHGDDLILDPSFRVAASADTLIGGYGDDTLSGSLVDIYVGGPGRDLAQLNAVTPSVNLSLYLDIRTLTASTSAPLVGSGSLTGVEQVYFTAHDGAGVTTTTFLDSDFGDFISTSGGNDVVVGAGGDDIIQLGAGADYADGGAGNDIIYDNDNGDYDQSADRLIGGVGNDQLIGAGSDFFDGGADSDAAIISYYGGVASPPAGAVYLDLRSYTGATFSLAPGGAIANVEFIGVAFGNEADTAFTSLVGGALDGAGGNDVLIGSNATDFLFGGAGSDYLSGGGGTDWITGASEGSIDGDFAATSAALLGGQITPAGAYDFFFTNIDFDPDSAADTILGGAGDDYIISGGEDFVDGGAGTDAIYINLQAQTASLYLDFRAITGASTFFTPGGGSFTGIEREGVATGSGADTILLNDLGGGADGGAGNDVIVGGAAHDVLNGNDGNDYIVGGDGDDILVGGLGVDEIHGGLGNDTIYGYEDNGLTEFDKLIGDDGDDFIDANYADYIDGGAGKDTATVDFDGVTTAVYFDFTLAADGAAVSFAQYGGSGSMRGVETFNAWGTQFGDTFIDGADSGSFYGQGGNDVLVGGGGTDSLDGGDGDDYINSGSLTGQVSTLTGGAGNDTIIGGAGDDYIDAGVKTTGIEADADTAVGGAGNDTIIGGDGNDYLNGGDDQDILYGDGGNDFLVGGNGDDIMWGGTGVDYMTGGAGADTFGLEALATPTTAEWVVITDYQLGVDHLAFDLTGSQFTGVVEGDFDGDGTADDTLLGFAGGNVVIANITGQSLANWNSFVVTAAHDDLL